MNENELQTDLGLSEYIEIYGWQEVERVASLAKTNRNYLAQIACGYRRPSYDLALRLVTASENKLSLTKLMKSQKNH